MSSKNSTDKETVTAVEEVKMPQAAEPAAATAEEKSEAVQTAAKPAEEKAEAEAEAVKEAKPAKAEKEEPKTARKSGTKKTVKKAEKPELKPEVYIEYHGQQVLETAVVEKVKAKFVASGHRVSSIKSLKLYIKPEEAKAFYVINEGKYADSVDLF